MKPSIRCVGSMALRSEAKFCVEFGLIVAVSVPPLPQDSKQVVESYKSGFEPPGDVEFEDYGQAMKRTASDTSLTTFKETKEKPGGKSKGKLWPFIKNKNKVTLRNLEAPTPAGPKNRPMPLY